MDLFDAMPDTSQDHPAYTLKSYVERADAKGAIAYLRSLTKDQLSCTLLSCGFRLTGNFRQWIDYAGAEILAAAHVRRLPRDPITIVS